MKIKDIKEREDSIFVVTFKPNWVEKLLGVVEKEKEYKDSDKIYTYGSCTVYIEKNGKELRNGHPVSNAIDKWRRRWN